MQTRRGVAAPLLRERERWQRLGIKGGVGVEAMVVEERKGEEVVVEAQAQTPIWLVVGLVGKGQLDPLPVVDDEE